MLLMDASPAVPVSGARMARGSSKLEVERRCNSRRARALPSAMSTGVEWIWLTGALVMAPVPMLAVAGGLSPLQTIERLHKAMAEADAATADALLHAEYHGLSLQGPPEHRHVYVETREKAVGDIAKLQRGEWQIRFLKSSTRIDANGLAHVWARYVFYYKGAPNHCGYESYGLFRTGEDWKIIFADTDNALKGRSVDEVCPDQ